MTPFEREVAERVAGNSKDEDLKRTRDAFLRASLAARYSYNFTWLGRPIIQYPQDIVAMQMLVWQVQPDLIIETGIAHGGSLILSASLLELNAACGGAKEARVLGIDIDIRAENRRAVEAHPLARRIEMIQGSSIDPGIVDQIRERAQSARRVLVCLDSNHTHDHVLAELEAYAPLVTKDSYCVVFDTVVEDLPAETSKDRPWGAGNNPKTAVWKYLETHPEFTIDVAMADRIMVTVAPDGFLRRIA